ncbi:GlsB/YeaQ/YmgE family stress response membrane protein [Breoghania sp.]|uniref:GlsB/YeaQ/YmgE family stress response membrane protein n=1 Tax=Breoghania sp. TaxID=2065378 RepID=UPI003204D93A
MMHESVLGILGAVVANAILIGLIDHTIGGFIGQLVVAVVGACLLIFVFRAIRR